MIRLLYSWAWGLALPLAWGRLWWRGRKEPGYRRHMAERFGFYKDSAPTPIAKRILWVHAVSVGETRAAEPLIDALLGAYSQHTVLLTHMTPTGRATGQSLFSRHGARVVQCYAPYDIGWMARRFLRHFAPELGVLMETEVWPNLIAQCVRYQVPLALVNARLSARSFAKGKRFGALMKEAAHGLSCVAAQTEGDAVRLRQLGARQIQVTGSIKFDVMPPETLLMKGHQLREQIGMRRVFLCASTREGEEALILDALGQSDIGDVLVVIVPRHPQRFDEVARLIAARGFAMERRSLLGNAALSQEVRVLLGDSMGEMFAYYAACDVAFIGGSLLPLGGQNLIEACALGKPVLIGPHTFNFSTISEHAIVDRAALRVQNNVALLREAVRLLKVDEERIAMGENAKAFAQQHRGATGRTMALLRPFILS